MSETPKVNINISIEIPLNGGVPVIKCHYGEKKPEERESLKRAIVHPNDAFPAPVKSTNGINGVICAKGTAPLDHFQQPPTRVTACIFQDPTTIPASYPTCGQEADSIGADGRWIFNEIGTARCGASGSLPQNKFVVWYTYSDGTILPVVTNFEGLCSNQTVCEQNELKPPTSEKPQKNAFPAIAPPVWKVDPQGFSGKVADRFNGPAELLLETGGCTKTLRWGAMNRHGASVRLILKDSVWTLHFKVDTIEVRYTHDAHGWNPMGVNTFQTSSSTGLSPRATLPAAITVTPASV